MVAVTQLIPKDPEEQASVLTVLREHPELREFIARATEQALEIFTDPEIHLDTVRYDEWDPPLNLIIRAPMPFDQFERAFDLYMKWLSPNPDYDRDLILVFPQFWGDPDEKH
jgi:hypothetical protein